MMLFLGNVMLLRRSISGGKALSTEESLLVLDEIAKRLRDVCQELSPRDLNDCGLRPMIEELCNSLSTRVGCQTRFTCPPVLPDLPQDVALHIYRIAQECFNNITKHASATDVMLTIELNQNVFTMTISDNGVGYDTEKADNPYTRRRKRSQHHSRARRAYRLHLSGTSGSIPSKAKGAKLTLEIMVSGERGEKKTD